MRRLGPLLVVALAAVSNLGPGAHVTTAATAAATGGATAGATAAAPAVHTVGGCQVFPADNPWNTRIDGRGVATRSTRIIQRQAAGHALHLDLGTTQEYYGIPVTVVPQDQATYPLGFGVGGVNYSDESDKGPVPFPADVHIEGGSTGDSDPGSGDRHVVVVRQGGGCRLIETYNTVRVYDDQGDLVKFKASAAARWNLDSNKLRPRGWTSADAAGLPIMPGLLDYDEAASGAITHALRFTLPTARAAYTWPARHCGPRGNTSPSLPAYGMRFRLKSSVSATRYTGVARTLVRAMKRYGLIYADQGSAMYVTGTSDPRWEKTLDQFRAKPLDGAKFEVVKPFRTIHVCR